MARVRAIEGAAALHRRAAALTAAAASVLDHLTPSVSPPRLIARQRALASTLAEAASAVAPDWLSTALEVDTRLPIGTGTPAGRPIRIGAGTPLPDASFPLLIPLLGAGHLAIEGPRHNVRTTGLLRSLVLRLLAASAPGTLRVRAVDSSGITFASFASLVEGRVMPEPAHDLAGLRALLDEAEQWVRVPATPGRHLLVVIVAMPEGTDATDLARLEALAAAGPDARLSLLVGDWPAERSLPHTTHVRLHGSTALVANPAGTGELRCPVTLDRNPPVALIESVCRDVAGAAHAATSLHLDDLMPAEVWTEDATDGLATIVGVTGNAPLTLRLGDLTPHWLVGGRSGAGKTALLIDVLYGLCSRYSPDDLALYLLDFKEGVSFTEFTPTTRDRSWMPHARAVGIESDRAYGLAVLRELDDEMTRRSMLFKDAGVTRFADLRPVARIPRIVCVIDEFQVLLGGSDRLAGQAVGLLESVARKGRSYGIHLILASQTMRGVESLYTKRDSIFGQFPVRIALPGGGDVLDVRNTAADALRLGTAIVNTAGGFGGPTNAARAHERLIEFPDPFAAPKALADLRRHLWIGRSAGSRAPYVFQGNVAIHLPRRIPKSRRPVAYLGRNIDVSMTDATFPMDATPGRHLAVIGPSETGADLLDAAARSLAAQHRPGTVTFVVAPLVAASDEVGGQLAKSLADDGHEVHVVDVAGLRAAVEAPPPDTYIVGFGMDGIGTDTRRLLREGPALRTHLIGWWRGLRRFGEDTGGSLGREDVAGVVLLNIPPADAAVFLGESDLDWRPGPNRALLHDRHVGRTGVIVPFARSGRASDEASVEPRAEASR